MSLSYRTTFNFDFTAEREADWPESLPWPDWKPNTEKLMRPMQASVTVRFLDKLRVSAIHVHGPRFNKAGVGLTTVHNEYHEGSDMPEFVRELVEDAKDIATHDVDQYQELDNG